MTLAIEAAHGQMMPILMSFVAGQQSVQEELNLSDEQRQQIRTLAGDIWAAEREAIDKEGIRKPPLTATPKEIEMEEARLVEILKPEQFKRLKEIFLQLHTFEAVKRPWAIKGLGLTGQQQEKLKAAIKKFQDDWAKNRLRRAQEVQDLVQEERRRSPESHGKLSAEAQAKYDKLTPEPKNCIFGVLTTEQQQKFEKMAGEWFDFPGRRRPPP
jgi:Spy/CpxP family protein refolding chaperone